MIAPYTAIAFVARSEWRFFLLELAELLKQRQGSVLHLYCMGRQEMDFYEARNRDGFFATINDASALSKAPEGPVADETAVIAKARAYEERLGFTYNYLAMANRHLGRGYALGGFYHPRSRKSERTGYLQMVNAYNKALEFWEDEIIGKNVTLMMNGPKEAFCMARLHGVPCRAIIGSRYKNFHYWAENEYFENRMIEHVYSHASASGPADISEPYASHMSYREVFLKRMGAWPLVKDLAWLTARRLYWRLRNYEKARGYFLSDELRYVVRSWQCGRELTGPTAARLSDLEDKPFVFFPLHAEPESSLQQASPEYFCQLAAIGSIARDLPAGYLLAVKETYQASGRRPDNFYDQIREFKNVVMLNMLELGLDVVRKAEAVVTITGTAGFEAAVMGKPVITFGRHNIYNFLPHVMVVRSEEELSACLRRALFKGIDRRQAAADGARFLRAVLACSFDMAKYDYVNPERVDPGIVEEAYQRLLDGLPVQPGQGVSA